jgi:hypothetical protein
LGGNIGGKYWEKILGENIGRKYWEKILRENFGGRKYWEKILGENIGRIYWENILGENIGRSTCTYIYRGWWQLMTPPKNRLGGVVIRCANLFSLFLITSSHVLALTLPFFAYF